MQAHRILYSANRPLRGADDRGEPPALLSNCCQTGGADGIVQGLGGASFQVVVGTVRAGHPADRAELAYPYRPCRNERLSGCSSEGRRDGLVNQDL